MGFTAMAFLWTGSQIPVYLFGMLPMKFLYMCRGFINMFKQVVFHHISMEILEDRIVGFGL